MEHKPYGPYETYFKRPLDILCALAALIVFGWLYILVAVLVRIMLLWYQQLSRVTVCEALSHGADHTGNGLSPCRMVYGRRFEHNTSSDA